MTRFVVTLDADLNWPRNTYIGGEVANIAEALSAGHIQPGIVAHVELSTGDVVTGSLVEIRAEEAR